MAEPRDGEVGLGAARRTLTVEGFAGAATLSGVVSGTAGLEKAGLGTLTLSGTNDYTGGTLVSDGVLAVASDAALGSTAVQNFVTVNGGTLRPTATFRPQRLRLLLGPRANQRRKFGRRHPE